MVSGERAGKPVLLAPQSHIKAEFPQRQIPVHIPLEHLEEVFRKAKSAVSLFRINVFGVNPESGNELGVRHEVR